MFRRTILLSSVLVNLLCSPVFAQMSGSTGNYSSNSSGGSFSSSYSDSYFGGGYSNSGYSGSSGSPMGGTTSTRWNNPSSYKPQPAKKPNNGPTQFKFLAKSAAGYSVYSSGQTLYVRGLTQDIINQYNINLSDWTQKMLAAYPGHQSVKLLF